MIIMMVILHKDNRQSDDWSHLKHKRDHNQVKDYKSWLPGSGNDSAAWRMFWCYICHPDPLLPPACVSAGLLSWFVEI